MFSLQDLNPTELKKRFENNHIIKYIILDNFLSENQALLIADEHRNVLEEYWLDYSHKNQRKSGLTDRSLMGKNTRSLLDELESPLFLEWLSNLTGFQNLIPDPDLDRAGLHRIKKGGYLNIHIDEMSHTKNKYWKRRINLLLYLASDHQKSWGGNLELWDNKNKKIIKSIWPKFNRCVVFATDNQSYHGHPRPLNCPEDLARRSIALYYYQKVDKPLFVTPTNYMSLPGDGLGKRILIRFNVLLLYIFAILKRYTKMTDEIFDKVTSFFR